MAELTINQLIKIIIGIVVFAAVVWGVYSVFKNYIIDFIGGSSGESVNLFLSLIR